MLHFDYHTPILVLPLSVAQLSNHPKLKIVFFDGNCPMCHSWVKRIISWDKKKIFRFAPLEGETAKEMLTPLLPDYIKEDTIIYFEEGNIFMRSDAAFRIVRALGFPYSLASLGLLAPKFFRDSVYNRVATRRYQFGKRYDSCPLPPVEWRDRFLS